MAGPCSTVAPVSFAHGPAFPPLAAPPPSCTAPRPLAGARSRLPPGALGRGACRGHHHRWWGRRRGHAGGDQQVHEPLRLPAPHGHPQLPPGANLNVSSIAARVEPATVDITANGPAGGDEGTGMIITASGTVLTNNHVIDGSMTLKAQVDGSGRSYTATVLGTDATDDIALLQLHGRIRLQDGDDR